MDGQGIAFLIGIFVLCVVPALVWERPKED